ncbi:CoxG family protein [Calidifontibacillus oryziterrae]|uniref:CoxG family protein n=1 Tax=Calidifontibacillus oryziterrae TaxID=1191699 RepID=UPI001E6534AF|nr:carbon monoxide dehydrogenase subunit G [Calidifontibacillus oryziterrae]
MLKIEYTYKFALPKSTVWTYIQDEDVLRNSLPGCKSFEEITSDVYVAELGLNTGPVKGLFAAEVQQTDQIPPNSYRLHVKGKGKPGEINAIAEMFLEETGDSTEVACIAEVEVTGLLAAVGQRVLGGVAKVILGQFFKAAEKEMVKVIS